MGSLVHPIMPFYSLLLALIFSPMLELASHRQRLWWLTHVFPLLAAAISLALVISLLRPGAWPGWPFVIEYGGGGIGTCFVVDRAALLMAVAVLSLAIITCIYGLGRGFVFPGYCVATTALLAGSLGVLLAGDLLTLYVAWEVMCLSAYALTAMGEARERALEAAWKYFVMGSAGAVIALMGMAILYGLAGTLNMPLLAERLRGASGAWPHVAFFFILTGLGVEAALFPLHTWLPDAYSEAPAMSSAIMAGVITEIGFYGLMKTILMVFQPAGVRWRIVLAAICMANAFVGVLSALVQTDIKRFLAYPCITTIGYMAAALVALTPDALTALLFLVLSHAYSKALGFLAAGSMSSAAGSRDITALGAARKAAPVATALLALSLLCGAGLPGTSGFVEKLVLLTAIFSSPSWWWLGLVLVLSAILAAAAYLRVLWAILKAPSEAQGQLRRVRPAELAAMLILSALVLLLGIWPFPFLELASAGAQDLLGGA